MLGLGLFGKVGAKVPDTNTSKSVDRMIMKFSLDDGVVNPNTYDNSVGMDAYSNVIVT